MRPFMVRTVGRLAWRRPLLLLPVLALQTRALDDRPAAFGHASVVSMGFCWPPAGPALRNAGQWTIGAACLYFTPQVVALIGGLWWAIVLGIVGAVPGWLFGAWLYRVHAPHADGVPASDAAPPATLPARLVRRPDDRFRARKRAHLTFGGLPATRGCSCPPVTIPVCVAVQRPARPDILPPALRVVN